MRTRRAFRPAFESMPTRAVPSSSLGGTDPTAPVYIPTQPPPDYTLPTDPYYIDGSGNTGNGPMGPDISPPINPNISQDT